MAAVEAWLQCLVTFSGCLALRRWSLGCLAQLAWTGCFWSQSDPWLPSKPYLLQFACAMGRALCLPGHAALLPIGRNSLATACCFWSRPDPWLSQRALLASHSCVACATGTSQAYTELLLVRFAGDSLIATCTSHCDAAPRRSTTHRCLVDPPARPGEPKRTCLSESLQLSLPAGMLPAEGGARPDARSDGSAAPAPSSEPVTDATLRIGSQELGPQAAPRQASEDEPVSLGRPSTGSSVRQAPQHLRTASGSSTEAVPSVGGPRSSAGGGQQAPQQGQAGMSQPGPSRPQAAPHGQRTARVHRVVPARLNAVPQAPPGGYTSLRIIGGKAVYVSHDGRQVSHRTRTWQLCNPVGGSFIECIVHWEWPSHD